LYSKQPHKLLRKCSSLKLTMTKTTPPVATSVTKAAGTVAETSPSNAPPSSSTPTASFDWIPAIAVLITLAGIFGYTLGRLNQLARWDVYGVDWQLFSTNLHDIVLLGFVVHYQAMGIFLGICVSISFAMMVFIERDIDKDLRKKDQLQPSPLQLAKQGHPLVWVIKKMALTITYIALIAMAAIIYIVIARYEYRRVVKETKAEIIALRNKNAAAFANELSNFAEITLKDNAPTLRGLVIQMNDKFLAIHDGEHMRILRLEAEVQSYKKVTADEAFAKQPPIATKPASQ
jgi:hypothetical protein